MSKNIIPKKGLITLKLNEPISIGDTISLEKETGSYTVSELMKNEHNITQTEIGQIVTIGRMKGKISSGDKIFKLSSKSLNQQAQESYEKENKKIPLNCKVTIQRNKPISINVSSNSSIPVYKNLNVNCLLDFASVDAKNKPLNKDTVIQQISKTASTPYIFENISVLLDDNIFLPKLSILNELRRVALSEVERYVLKKISRVSPKIELQNNKQNNYFFENSSINKDTSISLLLNVLHKDWNYSSIKGVSNVYIPLKYFTNKNYETILKTLSKKFHIYIYMPTIVKGNYKNLFYSNAKSAIENTM